jgi:glycerol-3-phosphate dehydrogenase
MTNQEDNIFFLLNENENENENENDYLTEQIDINDLLNEDTCKTNNDLLISHMIHYHENFSVKELFLICDYYDISKNLKIKKKYTKDAVVKYLVEFEMNNSNIDIVSKRQNMWFYMNELKNDKFMKKFLLW